MGLLTNVKTRRKLVTLISHHNNKLCFLSYVAGFVWFLALAYRPFNASTYFSENALLPGLVEAHFHHEHGASDILRNLNDELRAIRNLKEKEKIHRIPSSWFEEQFRNIGLDTYVQNYTFKYPANILGEHTISGQNVYGILRAPKTASTEAVVLSVPYRPPDSEMGKTNAGIALLLALAKSFRQHTYWAKDIILLVTEHDSVGMQAWLGAYHHDHNEYISASELHGRSGSIQAALNLEIGTDTVQRFNIKLEGLNGQLPNLDLINTVVRLCRRENINPTLQNRVDTWDTESWNGFEHSLRTMVAMMRHQAPGSPSGNHGLFHRYHIEAITLQGVRLKTRAGAGFREMGRVVEGVCRSLNNLLERFHQSFFFYLLPATDRYVSIGLYMPPFGLLAAPILIKALALWISVTFSEEEVDDSTDKKDKDKTEGEEKKEDAGENKEEGSKTAEEKDKEDTADKEKEGCLALSPVIQALALWISVTFSEEEVDDSTDKKDKDKTEGGEKKEDAGENKEEGSKTAEEKDKEDTADKEKEKPQPQGLISVVPVCIMAVMFGFIALNGPKYSMDAGRAFRMKPTEALSWGALALQVSAMLFPRILKRKADQKGDVQGPEPALLKCVGLLWVGVVVGALSLMNISLAFLITAVWTPVLLLTYPAKRWLLNLLQYPLLLLISPMGLLYGCSAVSAATDSLTDVADIHTRAWAGAQQALLTAVVDGGMLGSCTYGLVSLAIFPAWLIFWALLWTEPRRKGSEKC